MSNNYIVINGESAELTEDQPCKIGIAIQRPKPLGTYVPGDTVRIGYRDFVVLDQDQDLRATAVITKESVKNMGFGGSGDYTKSDIRKYLNSEFYNELVAAVGADKIYAHRVDLEADDGTRSCEDVCDAVSLLTTQEYRKYRELLSPYGEYWWTTTRVTAEVDEYGRLVCYVFSNGMLLWGGCEASFGVRPFCILDSSISVSCD